MDAKILLITQARLGSSRLPGKVLKKIGEKSLIQIHLERLKKCKNVSEIIVATTIKEEDNIIFDKAIEYGVSCTRGSELEVLDLYYQAARVKNADWIVRVTSDCPLIDPDLVDKVISFVIENDKDYGANILIENYPDGQDIEVFKFSTLETAWSKAELLSEREHVTLFIRNNSDINGGDIFTAINYNCEEDYSKIRMTVDEESDFELVKVLINELGIEKSWIDYTHFIMSNNLTFLNENIIRNEGLLKSLKNDK